MEKAAAAERQNASSALTSLSHRLAKQFTAAHGDPAGNLVFSPLSVYSALSLVAAGAQGKTLRELLDLLGTGSRDGLHVNVRAMVEQAIPASPPPQATGPRVSYASGLWHDSRRTLKPAYRDVAAASFRSVARAVDFLTKADEARMQINSWVAESTNNLIDSILPPGSVNSSTRIVVTNAIYFKGIWDTAFDEQRTKEGKFHRLDGSSVTAQFMSSSRRQFIGVHDGFKVLRMPYSTVHWEDQLEKSMPMPPRYSMCILLPDTRGGLLGLIDAMASSSPSFLLDHLPLSKVDVREFRVPRFKMTFSTAMKGVLRDLGVRAMFSGAAELPDLLEESHEPLILWDVLHKAVIEVNEEGKEAAAAVTVCYTFSSSGRRQPPPRVDFVADHPFAFFVVEEVSGAILFAGHVLDPTQES